MQARSRGWIWCCPGSAGPPHAAELPAHDARGIIQISPALRLTQVGVEVEALSHAARRDGGGGGSEGPLEEPVGPPAAAARGRWGSVARPWLLPGLAARGSASCSRRLCGAMLASTRHAAGGSILQRAIAVMITCRQTPRAVSPMRSPSGRTWRCQRSERSRCWRWGCSRRRSRSCRARRARGRMSCAPAGWARWVAQGCQHRGLRWGSDAGTPGGRGAATQSCASRLRPARCNGALGKLPWRHRSISPDQVEGQRGDGGVQDGLEQDVHRVLGPDGAGAELRGRRRGRGQHAGARGTAID